MTVFIFGCNGMLGNYVYTYFTSKTNYNVMGITRKDIDLSDPINFRLLNGQFSSSDVIINCAGIIPQRNNSMLLESIMVNSVFPQYISKVCKKVGAKFINISTDCCFSGKKGSYNEDSIHDALGIYGRTKSLGEPLKDSTIRTSIIGEELNNFCSLIEWVKSNKNKEVLGYTNHIWNGISCLQFAKICEYMIDNNFFWEGVKHLYSPDCLNKYELIKLISKVYGLNVIVSPLDVDGGYCNRTLSSIKDKFPLDIPGLETQLIEQKEFFNKEVIV